MTALKKRLRALPQELQDLILDRVFWQPIDPTTTRIDNYYCPPVGLQIDSKSRKCFAQQYYRDVTIVVCQLEDSAFTKWIASLSREHQLLVKRVNYGCYGFPPNQINLEAFVCNLLVHLKKMADITCEESEQFLWIRVQPAKGMEEQGLGDRVVWLSALGNREEWERGVMKAGFRGVIEIAMRGV